MQSRLSQIVCDLKGSDKFGARDRAGLKEDDKCERQHRTSAMTIPQMQK